MELLYLFIKFNDPYIKNIKRNQSFYVFKIMYRFTKHVKNIHRLGKRFQLKKNTT